MTKTGFSEVYLRRYVLHDDEDGQHTHIIASRMPPDTGKLYLGKNENLISTRVIKELEQDYQSTRTKRSDALKPYASSVKRKRSRNEAMLEERTGRPYPKSTIQGAIDSITLNPIAIDDFAEKPNSMGITAKSNIASTGKMNGFSFECKGVVFKTFQLGRRYSWKNLEPIISMDFSSSTREERPVILVSDTSHSNETVIPIVEDYPDKKVCPEIELPSTRPDIAPTKPISMTMRWTVSALYLVSIISALKTICISPLKVFNGPAKFFSMSMIHLSLGSLKQARTDSSELKSSYYKAYKPLLP